MTSSLPKLLTHMAWADRRTLDALRAMREPPAQAVDLFAHILAAQHVWSRRIAATSAAYEIWPRLSLDECERLAAANQLAYASLAAADQDMLTRTVRYTNSSGSAFETPLLDILLHVTHHSMYHRGQVSLLLRAAGGVPVGTDLIVFLRE